MTRDKRQVALALAGLAGFLFGPAISKAVKPLFGSDNDVEVYMNQVN